MTSETHGLLSEISKQYMGNYNKKNVILNFHHFLDLVAQNPRQYIRNAAEYLLHAFNHYGSRTVSKNGLFEEKKLMLFDIKNTRSQPVIGGEFVQKEIYECLEKFVQSGKASKLILLHGPNGSSKSSTIDAIAAATEYYSHTEVGCVYRFNWIFPSDKDTFPHSSGEGSIGFNTLARPEDKILKSFALLEDHKMASKISSDYKENPIYLLPLPYRIDFLKTALSKMENKPIESIELPNHMYANGLSKRNQQIFENLLNAYGGNLAMTLRHVQVERFFFSKQYRVGIATIEPQMSIDAYEKQLTLDKNYSNLPAVLQSMSFHQAHGELIEANRGFVEFSDMLKRPVEAFKYLLNTIEKSTIHLSSGPAELDVVFFATTNEKHLDSFKTLPDFSSFKGRFDLIHVPYLLFTEDEALIYLQDIEIIKKTRTISPHTLELLCRWAVMTRLKQPDPEQFPKEYRALIARLDPHSKALLYEQKSLQPEFTHEEQALLNEIRPLLWSESRGCVVYEGRFGASPREIKALLYKASQHPDHLTPMAMFEELKNLNKNRSVYDFLQFEPRGKYHDTVFFLEALTEDYCTLFEREAISSMHIADEHEYELLFKKYVDHVVAEIKHESLWDDSINAYTKPSQHIMDQVESILDMKTPKDSHRGSVLSRIAAAKIDHPKESIVFKKIFADYLEKIKTHFFDEKRKQIEHTFETMVAIEQGHSNLYQEQDLQKAQDTYEHLHTHFGYTRAAVLKSLQFLMRHKKHMFHHT